MDTIQPASMSFGQLFQQRLFEIPEYQRAYSWETKHRRALFSDIERLVQRSDGDAHSGHFMATIVGLRRDKKAIGIDKYQRVEVVDGQQRITTLILLLKAISKKVGDPVIQRDIDELLVKRDATSVLLSNHDSKGYFREYIRHGTHPTPKVATKLSDRQMLLAIDECERFVARGQIPPQVLASVVKNELSCVFYELTDESVVYTVFEVLNSRGLAVSWFDRLKSMLMATVFNADVYKGSPNGGSGVIDEVHELWSQIYEVIGLRLGLSTESLRFAATLKDPEIKSRPLSEERSAELLAGQSVDPASVIVTTKWLLKVTEAVDSLHSDRRMNAVTEIRHARLVAVAINLRSDITVAEKRTLLRRWENVTFRIFGMCRRDARTGVGDYVRLAWQIANEDLPVGEILKGLSYLGIDYPIEDAIEQLREQDCYNGWEEELRYFMQRREEFLARENGQNFANEQWNRIWEDSAASSIEHITPQSAGSEYIHHLGNLVVLPPGLNSRLQDKTPREKATAYVDTGLFVAAEVAQRISANGSQQTKRSSGWQRRDVATREGELLDWACTEWAD